jgi:hypothetical protein
MWAVAPKEKKKKGRMQNKVKIWKEGDKEGNKESTEKRICAQTNDVQNLAVWRLIPSRNATSLGIRFVFSLVLCRSLFSELFSGSYFYALLHFSLKMPT